MLLLKFWKILKNIDVGTKLRCDREDGGVLRCLWKSKDLIVQKEKEQTVRYVHCFSLQHLLHEINQHKDALFIKEYVSYCVMTLLLFP